MFFKFVVFAFLLASPILASPESQRLGFRNENLANKSIIESIKNSLQKYTETAREAYVEALEAIHKQVEYLENELVKEIIDLKELAHGKSDCYTEYQQEILNINQNTISEVKICVSDVVAQLTKLFNSLVESLNEINERLLVLLDEMNGCGDIVCYGKMAKKIAEEVLNVNSVMGDKITEFLAIMRENKEARVCVADSMNKYVGNIKEAVAKYRECVAQ